LFGGRSLGAWNPAAGTQRKKQRGTAGNAEALRACASQRLTPLKSRR